MKKLGTAEEAQRQGALALLKRLPPQDLEDNLDDLAKIAPHLEQSLAPFVSRPSKLKYDETACKYFVACDYNREGDGPTASYRSPWTNTYMPAPGGTTPEEDKLFRPPARLRQLEETFNEVFDAYKTAYYEGGVSSVYLWDLDEGFVGAFVIRKEIKEGRGMRKGLWDIVHVAEVRESANSSDYKLYTTLSVHVLAGKKAVAEGETELGGYFTRQVEERKKKAGEDGHLVHIGKLIQDTELSLRQQLDTFYMAKHREVLNAVRQEPDVDQPHESKPRTAVGAKAGPQARGARKMDRVQSTLRTKTINLDDQLDPAAGDGSDGLAAPQALGVSQKEEALDDGGSELSESDGSKDKGE